MRQFRVSLKANRNYLPDVSLYNTLTPRQIVPTILTSLLGQLAQLKFVLLD